MLQLFDVVDLRHVRRVYQFSSAKPSAPARPALARVSKGSRPRDTGVSFFRNFISFINLYSPLVFPLTNPLELKPLLPPCPHSPPTHHPSLHNQHLTSTVA